METSRIKSNLNVNLYPETKLVKLSELTNSPVRSGLDLALFSGGEIVNIVSEKYGHMDNKDLFGEVETQLDKHGIKYEKRGQNRGNRAFAVDYILNDDSIAIDVKNDKQGVGDIVRPMVRFTNSYDGSGKTSGFFGFHRLVCENGLTIAETELEFSIKHRGNMLSIAIPHIDRVINRFINNEAFALRRKFDVLAERPIKDVKEFVKEISGLTGILEFSRSERNPNEPSKNAQLVMDTIDREAKLLHTSPNMWLGYNAFNAFIHSDKRGFDQQRKRDEVFFGHINKLQSVLN